jgi:hypothetical protein
MRTLGGFYEDSGWMILCCRESVLLVAVGGLFEV